MPLDYVGELMRAAIKSDALLAQIGIPIVATAGVQCATGFFGTFISLRVTLENFSPLMAGLAFSGYFAGFMAGAAFCGRVISRIGYIRAYVAFGGMVIIATDAMSLMVSPLPWAFLRGVIGFGCAGLFVTTESWLNAKARPTERGRIFSTYMVGKFVALGLGQTLIARIEIETSTPFNIIIAFFAIGLVLVSMTRAEAPQLVAEALPYGRLAQAAPVAVAGTVLSGIITSAFYALVPMWMQGRGIGRETIGLVMLAAVLGGLAFQIPVGQLSDRCDRRIVLAGLGIGLAAVAVSLVHLPRTLSVLVPLAASLGGFMSTLYPVCVAHAHDRMSGDRVVAVSSRLLLVSGLGSVLGPLLGTGLIAQFGIDGMLYFMAATAFVLACIAAGWSFGSIPKQQFKRPFTMLAPQAVGVAYEPLPFADDPDVSGRKSR